MRKRNIRIVVRLNDEENRYLIKHVESVGISREAYMRQLITGLRPREKPPPEYHKMIWELNHIGNNLNQIAAKANGIDYIDEKLYWQEVEKLNESVMKIICAVTAPERIE